MVTGPRPNVVTRIRCARDRGGLEPLRDEGAVAVITALCISTFLLGFAALALDFGQVYARKGGQQSLADLAALTGAARLPNRAVALDAALDELCPIGGESEQEQAQGWVAGTCADRDDFSDGDETDGEVTFYKRDMDKNGVYEEIDESVFGDTRATALRVVLPSSRVVFGLGQTFGASGMSVSAAATARIGTALASGLMPFAVLTGDQTPAKDYRWCVKDPAETGIPDNVPPENPQDFDLGPIHVDNATRIEIVPSSRRSDDPNRTVTVYRRGNGILSWAQIPMENGTRVYWRTPNRRLLPATPAGLGLRVTVPVDVDLDEPAQMWIEWGTGPNRNVSLPATYSLTPPIGTAEPCQRVEALRGYGSNFDRVPPAADDDAELITNIRRGVQPEVRRWPENAGLLDIVELALPVLAPTVTSLRCGPLNLLLGTLGVVNEQLQAAVVGILGFINCMQTDKEGFAPAMTTGLLDAGAGRDTGLLTRQCSTVPRETIDQGYTIDNTNLLNGGSSPIVNGAFGTPDQLRTVIENGGVPAEGWIKNDALRCPRMVAMPVLDVIKPNRDASDVEDGGQYPIADITYAWIDDGVSGLQWAPGNQTLKAFRGHVIPPEAFPDVVTGSPVVGEYLGDYLPKQAVLVRDRSDVL